MGRKKSCRGNNYTGAANSPSPAKDKGKQKLQMNETFAEEVAEDVLCLILCKLPAKDLASAAFVSRSCNRASTILLSKPKLVSAVSLLTFPEEAVNEAADKVLAENNIRPQFVIACFTLPWNANCVHQYVRKRLGTKTPIVANLVEGAIGVNAAKNAFIEVTAENMDQDLQESGEDNDLPILGLVLIVGWIPDMKVEVIPLQEPQTNKGKQKRQLMNNFIYKIRKFSKSVSGSTSPAAVILFGDEETEKVFGLLRCINDAFPPRTVISGHLTEYPLDQCSGENESEEPPIVALTFAMNKDNPCGVGETKFHLPLMSCVSRIGPVFSVASVETRNGKSDITAMNEDGTILDCSEVTDTLEATEGELLFKNLYVGVEKQAKKTNQDAAGTSTSATSLSLHQAKIYSRRGCIVVEGGGINPGESFSFYCGDLSKGLSSCNIAVLDRSRRPDRRVFGGIVFVVQSRIVGLLNFNNAGEYSEPLLDKFPSMSLGGMFTTKTVRRGPIELAWKDEVPCTPRWSYNNNKGIQFIVMSHSPLP